MFKFKVILISLLCLLMPGCKDNNILDRNPKKKQLDLRTFFDGKLDGWGVILDYKGKKIRSFYVKIEGTYKDNKGVLKEWFEFDDHSKMKRKWNINFIDNKMFTATAKDVVNTAKGTQFGDYVNVKYTFKIPFHNKIIKVNMDDWMFLVEDQIVLNRINIKKFGFKVGEMIICLKKIT